MSYVRYGPTALPLEQESSDQRLAAMSSSDSFIIAKTF